MAVGIRYGTVNSIPDGSKVLPTSNVKKWIKTSGVHFPYSTLSEVFDDTACMTALLSSQNACNYWVRSSSDFLTTCFSNSSFVDVFSVSHIYQRAVASNTTLSNIANASPYWYKAWEYTLPRSSNTASTTSLTLSDGSVLSSNRAIVIGYMLDGSTSTISAGDAGNSVSVSSTVYADNAWASSPSLAFTFTLNLTTSGKRVMPKAVMIKGVSGSVAQAFTIYGKKKTDSSWTALATTASYTNTYALVKLSGAVYYDYLMFANTAGYTTASSGYWSWYGNYYYWWSAASSTNALADLCIYGCTETDADL